MRFALAGSTPGIEGVVNDHPVTKHLVVIGEHGREAE
jgi:hypothetical protein